MHVLKHVVLLFIFFFSLAYSTSLEEEVEKDDSTTQLMPICSLALGNECPVSGYANLETVFERIIPLGQRCPNKMELNLLFNPAEPDYNKTKKGHADLFDWSAIFDYNLFSQALSNNLTDFFEVNDFVHIPEDRKKIVLNTKYNIRWSHLFDNSEICWRRFSLDTFKEQFLRVKEKIEYLRQKFISAKDYKTLYIIVHEAEGLDEATLRTVRNSLLTIREGSKDFVLLAISKIKMSESFENIIVRDAPKFKLRRKGGKNTPRWKQILDEFTFTPEIWS